MGHLVELFVFKKLRKSIAIVKVFAQKGNAFEGRKKRY